MRICLPLRRPVKPKQSIFPIFLPFLGCPEKCIFCAQHSQTGVGDIGIDATLQGVREALQQRIIKQAPPVELGFFGGTFTSMPASSMQKCIDLVQEYVHKGAVLTARCSTRPDALNPALLHKLHAGNFSTIELGIQSFNTSSLQTACRGYTGLQAEQACHMVGDAGLQLGVQLLPGMPGVSPEVFTNDVRLALTYGAKLLRFYPCLVISGTILAQMWRDAMYIPWTLDTSLTALTEGYILAMAQGVPVVRMGLAPEPSLTSQILAGPEHPALGAMVQARALVQVAEQCLQGRMARKADVDRNCQGFFWGHKGEYRQRWARIGLTASTVQWHDALPSDTPCIMYV